MKTSLGILHAFTLDKNFKVTLRHTIQIMLTIKLCSWIRSHVPWCGVSVYGSMVLSTELSSLQCYLCNICTLSIQRSKSSALKRIGRRQILSYTANIYNIINYSFKKLDKTKRKRMFILKHASELMNVNPIVCLFVFA